MPSHPAAGTMPRLSGGDQREPPSTKSFRDGGLGEGAPCKKSLPPGNCITVRTGSTCMLP